MRSIFAACWLGFAILIFPAFSAAQETRGDVAEDAAQAEEGGEPVEGDSGLRAFQIYGAIIYVLLLAAIGLLILRWRGRQTKWLANNQSEIKIKSARKFAGLSVAVLEIDSQEYLVSWTASGVHSVRMEPGKTA